MALFYMRMATTRGRRGRRAATGFTLIELMVTVAVIGLLAAIAYPSYREQIAKGRRAEATGILLEANQWMERFYAENYRYDQNTAGVAVTDAQLFAARFSQSPRPPGGAAYTITLSPSPTATTYTVAATRTGTMASDRCGDFTITQTGTKGVKAGTFDSTKYANAAAALAACWK